MNPPGSLRPGAGFYELVWSKLVRVFSIILVLVSINPLPIGRASPTVQTGSSKERAQTLLDGLTPEEKVGQLFLVTFNGTQAGLDSQIYDLIVNRHIGGVILQAQNNNFAPAPQTLVEAQELVRQIQTDEWSATQSTQIDPVDNHEFTPAFIPLFIGISQEGDGLPYDQIINGLTSLPSQMALGATWDPEMAQRVGTVLGKELSILGINLLLGPSLDVLDTPHPQGTGDLGVRTFGGDPYWVGEMGRAYINGVHTGSEGRIAVVGKHFPGYGSSDRLPEEEVATVRKSLEQLKLIELPPFYAVTGNAPSPASMADALLASHIRYQGFQGNIRETTRPLSLDAQNFTILMDQPPLARWRENGGVMISDNLGSRAFRRYYDPSGQTFNARRIALDAFVAGNDLLFLGANFIDPLDTESYQSILRTLDFFAQKYREDVSFAQAVDTSVLRILTLKFRLYQNIFTLTQVLPFQRDLAELGTSGQVTFEVAQKAATLISPSLADLADTLPEPPKLNDRIVFISDVRQARQCSLCPEQVVLAKDGLQRAVVSLYGPFAGGQVLPRNLESFSFAELQVFLDSGEQTETPPIEDSLRRADWIVISSLNVTPNISSSQSFSRFLAERPDLFRQKKLVLFAFNAPYFLDQTEVSKLVAYYGLYSKTSQFVEVAARLLFGEIPSPSGDLPISVIGVGYDLGLATSPDPDQIIPLFLDLPVSSPSEGTATPGPSPITGFEIGDLIPVRTGIIRDHNGHPVPDDTPVKFILSVGNQKVKEQDETTQGGIARTTFPIDQSGTVEISVESEPVKNSFPLRFEVPPIEGELVASPTPIPTDTQTPEPSPTSTPTPESTPALPVHDRPNLGDWLLAILVTSLIGGGIYWVTVLFGVARWGMRGALLTAIGGLLAYTYLALGMPGSSQVLQNAGTGGVLTITILGAGLGWGASWGWQWLQSR